MERPIASFAQAASEAALARIAMLMAAAATTTQSEYDFFGGIKQRSSYSSIPSQKENTMIYFKRSNSKKIFYFEKDLYLYHVKIAPNAVTYLDAGRTMAYIT